MLDTPPSSTEITTTNCYGTKHLLKINKPSDTVHLLGVHIAANGNQHKELQVLKQHQTKYAQFLLITPLIWRET